MKSSPIDRLLRPIHAFIHQEFTGGIVLFISVVIALVWANGPWAAAYHELWETKFAVSFAGRGLDHSLHTWINDGLMALFFFVIGLELKREFMGGELSSVKKAALPMVAAVGGMLVPALIYTLFNYGRPSAGGWGIPMATDIAFALGLLSLAGRRVPLSVKVFLSALAVADDLGAVLVIAFFYSSGIAFVPLLVGGFFLLLLWAGNMLGIRHTAFYLVLGLGVWLGFLFSGVHATIAGVLVAFMIPARTKVNERDFVLSLRKHSSEFEQAVPKNGSLMTTEQHHNIESIKQLCLDAQTPLQKIENGLHPWVAFVIMPLFALANAGVLINSRFFSALVQPVGAGIMTGLIAGKFIGVFFFTWVMVRLRLAALPQGANWKHITGVALLAGVGFTMSLFITELAFDAPAMADEAKAGILVASTISGVAGLCMLKRS